MNKYTYEPPCTLDELEKAYFEDGLSQAECGERFEVSQKVIFTAMRHYNLKPRKAAKRDQYGEANHMWKGNKAGKQALHRRLYSRFGKPNSCTVCGTSDDSKSYDYANLSGDYNNLNDYAAMCRSCHWKYDKKILNIKHMNNKLAGGKTHAGE